MTTREPEDIERLVAQFDDNDRRVRDLVAGITPEQGVWRPRAGGWSIAECLDHLAVSNRVYVAAMRPAALRARERSRMRRGPALPGTVGRWFVSTQEPPVIRRMKAPGKIVPRQAPALSDAVD